MKTAKKEINNLLNDNIHTGILAFLLLILINILMINMKLGMIIFAGLFLILIVLIKPKLIYYFTISLFALENFSLIQGATYAKIVGILLVFGLAMRLSVTKEALPEDYSYKYFFLFVIGSLFSVVFAKNLSTSVVTYITYISLLFLYIVSRYFLRNIEDIQKVLNYLFIATFLTSAYVVFTTSIEDSDRFSGGVGDANAYALYILVLIPLAIYRIMGSKGIYRLLYWGCLASFLALLVLTGSRAGVLGFLGAAGVLILYYIGRRLKQVLALITVLVVILYFFVPESYWYRVSTIKNSESDYSIQVRLENYKVALKMFLDHPVVGVGIHNFKDYRRDYGLPKEYIVHNSYLEVLAGGGLLSFIPFSLILLSIWKKLITKNNYDRSLRNLFICLKASFVSILITSFFITAEHKKILWLLFALISSAYYISRNNNNVETKKS